VPVLVAIGVDELGYKCVLSFQSGDKESASSWREFFKDLKQRGLQSSFVKLGIMDGLPALEKVFKEEFINAKVQRCQVHLSKNILSKVTAKEKRQVADDLRSILYPTKSLDFVGAPFYASSKEKAIEFYEAFIDKYTKDFPSATKSLQRSIHSALTFFDFNSEDWISIRTTNVIERLNKEFKRRTKSFAILAGESSCYNLLAFISLKMESYWATKPIGRFTSNLPSLKRFYEFTQNC
jgi:transposase-like protein